MSRSLRVLTFDLATARDGVTVPGSIDARYLTVLEMPAAAEGLVRLGVDGSDSLPLRRGRRVTACQGERFRTLQLTHPALTGTLELAATNDEAVIADGGGGAAATGSDLWEEDKLWWPGGAGIEHGSAMQTSAFQRFGGATITNFWGAAIGGATQNMQRYRDQLAGSWTMGGGGTSERIMDGASAFPCLYRNAVAARFQGLEARRCFIWDFLLAMNTGAGQDDETGLALELAAGTAPGWIRLGNNGMALLRDGAGWRYSAKRSNGVGVYTESVALTWPAALAEWVHVRFQVKSATGERDAEFALYADDVLLIERDWSGATLPRFGDSGVPANAARLVPHVRAGNGAGSGAVYLGGARYRAGRYTFDGAEV